MKLQKKNNKKKKEKNKNIIDKNGRNYMIY